MKKDRSEESRKYYLKNKKRKLKYRREHYLKNQERIIKEQCNRQKKEKADNPKEYKFKATFMGIKSRCNNKNHIAYEYYGGKGIRCEWKTIGSFKEDMFDSFLKHIDEHGFKQTTIERLDNSSNYCKENCIWATWAIQSKNKSKYRTKAKPVCGTANKYSSHKCKCQECKKAWAKYCRENRLKKPNYNIKQSINYIYTLMILPLLMPSVTVYEAEEVYQPKQVTQLNSELTEANQIMKSIAFCESSNKHFREDGSVLTGIVDPRDTGRYQINTYYHQETAESMGLDIFKEEDNETYALWLYETQGTQPWSASYKCMRRQGLDV